MQLLQAYAGRSESRVQAWWCQVYFSTFNQFQLDSIFRLNPFPEACQFRSMLWGQLPQAATEQERFRRLGGKNSDWSYFFSQGKRKIDNFSYSLGSFQFPLCVTTSDQAFGPQTCQVTLQTGSGCPKILATKCKVYLTAALSLKPESWVKLTWGGFFWHWLATLRNTDLNQNVLMWWCLKQPPKSSRVWPHIADLWCGQFDPGTVRSKRF